MKVCIWMARHEASRMANLLDMIARSDSGIDGISAANFRNTIEYALAKKPRRPKRTGKGGK